MNNICNERIENHVNQKRLEDYLFGDKYKLSDIVVDMGGTRITIDRTFILIRISYIAEGAYGAVYKYGDTSNSVNIAIKFAQRNDEEDISNELRNSGCDVLRVRYLGKQIEFEGRNIYPYFMELADGDLTRWVTKMFKNYPYGIPKQIIFNVLEKLWRQMNCLFENNRVYVDIKLENILFKCDDPLKIGEDGVRFMIGDLGGAVPDDDGDLASTYPPFEYRDRRGFIRVRESDSSDKAILAWEFGILVLFLTTYMEGMKPYMRRLLDLINDFSFARLPVWNEGMKNSIINMLKSYNNRTVVDISKLLDLEPSNRKWTYPVYNEREQTDEAEKPLNQNNEILPPFPAESEVDPNQDVNCAYKKLSLNDIYRHLSDCSAKNYRMMSMKLHPDKNVGCKNTELINQNFTLLGQYEDICKQRNRVPFVFGQPRQPTPRQPTPRQPTNDSNSSSIIYGEWKIIERKRKSAGPKPRAVRKSISPKPRAVRKSTGLKPRTVRKYVSPKLRTVRKSSKK
jgi:serine/threonine protein kinase